MKAFACALALASVAYARRSSYLDNMLMALSQKQYNGANFSPINMEVDGKPVTYYVAAGFQSAGGHKYHVPAEGRGYIATSPKLDLKDPEYFKPNLLNGSIEWDVDLSGHECGCIAAFYLTSMPGRDQNGDLWMQTDGWGYCDANAVAGNLCPEFDMMEANKFSFATTPHACEAPDEKGFYRACDGDGHCNMNAYEKLDWNGYGPGETYTINTDLPFHVKVSFDTDSVGTFDKFTTTMTQNGRQQSMTAFDCDWSRDLTEDLRNGMGLVISNWSGNASWLWHDRCSGSCTMPELTISNIKVTTGK